MQQRVEILKALYRGADLLILDEPTAVLTPQEIEDLIQIMHNLIADGKTIIIITHKLKEIKESSDVCTIIRRGKYVDTVAVQEVDEEDVYKRQVRNPHLIGFSITDHHLTFANHGFHSLLLSGVVKGEKRKLSFGRDERPSSAWCR